MAVAEELRLDTVAAFRDARLMSVDADPFDPSLRDSGRAIDG
jgi:hypothetical protein